MNGLKINTLWIDDKPNPDFVNWADEKFDIDIEVCTCHEDGMAALQNPNSNWDAVILDANCKITNDPHEVPSLDSLTASMFKIHEFCKSYDKSIPWFVYTGGSYDGRKELQSRIPKRVWDDRPYYNKPIDMNKLFENIKKAVEKSDKWKMKKQYEKVFEIFENKSSINALGDTENSILLKLLIAKDSIKEASNPDHLNNIRKFIAGGVMKTIKKMGVIPEGITDLNVKSRHLGNIRFKNSIPIHIQRAFHAIISTCQDGSHGCNEGEEGEIPPQIDKLVREGNAPYLLSSLVYELLNILIWLKGFMESHNDKEQNLLYFKYIEKSK